MIGLALRPVALLLSAAVASNTCAQGLALDAAARAVAPWFAASPGDRGAPPSFDRALDRADAAALVPLLFAACRDGARERGEDTLPTPTPVDAPAVAAPGAGAPQPSELVVGDDTFPYVLLVKGERPARGWPLFVCLHGGGGNGDAAGPHAWSVNTREWAAQQALARRVYAPAGLYFVPRMADDRRGRWWLDHNQRAFDLVIRRAIQFCDVDPNRVYLLGISEGGYGAIRFAANAPDRFAATGGMAAAEPLSTSPPENMRNVAMRIDIGERDTMFDRIGLARRMGAQLAALRAADPDGYDCEVHVQAGRGHGIDYSLTPKWVAERVRDPRPRRLVWTVKRFDKLVTRHWYWLALDDAPEHLPLYLEARVDGNHIEVKAEQDRGGEEPATRAAARSGRLRVRLDDRLVDLDRPVTIAVNGAAPQTFEPARRLEVMARTMAEYGDPEYCFCAEVVVELAPR